MVKKKKLSHRRGSSKTANKAGVLRSRAKKDAENLSDSRDNIFDSKLGKTNTLFVSNPDSPNNLNNSPTMDNLPQKSAQTLRGKLFSLNNRLFSILIGLIFAGVFCAGVYVFATAWPYTPPAPLDPGCSPSDPTCTVKAPLTDSFTADFSGSGNFTTTNTITAGTLKVGSAYSLPTANGAAGYVLISNGDGTTTWTAAAQGPKGDTGAAGATGATGQGFTNQGAYASGTTYHAYDVITSGGSSYLVIATTTGNAPPNPSYYLLWASKGDTGAQGPPGSGGTLASPSNSIQFNNAGAFGGSSNLTWDGTNKAVSFGNSLINITNDGTNPAIEIGNSATANSNNGIAIGHKAVADDMYSISIGSASDISYPIATGVGSIAIGNSSYTTYANSVAIGYGTGINGVNSTVIGAASFSNNTAANAVVLGYNVDSKGPNSIAIGTNNTEAGSESSIAIGNNAWTKGVSGADSTNSIAIGASALTTNTSSVALGNSAQARGANSIAIGGSDATAVSYGPDGGMTTAAYALGSIAIGPSIGSDATYADSDYSIAFGAAADTDGANSIAIGGLTYTTAGYSSAVGWGADANGLSSVALGNNAFVNATGSYVSSPGDQSIGSVAIGYMAETEGSNDVVVGASGKSNSSNGVAIGNQAYANGNTSIAIGGGEETMPGWSAGGFTHADGQGAIAIGGAPYGEATTNFGNTQAMGNYSIALGVGAEANNFYSIAIGTGSESGTGECGENNGRCWQKEYSIALGVGADAEGFASTAIGYGAYTTRYNEIVFSTSNSWNYRDGRWPGIAKIQLDIYGDMADFENNSIKGQSLVLAPRVSAPESHQNGQMYFSTSNVLYIYKNGWQTIASSSSLRFKHDIQPLADDWSKILQVQPKSFLYNDQPDNTLNIGYIAEDFDALGLKDLVQYDDQGRPSGINYDKISLYDTEIIKQQQIDINAIKQRLGIATDSSVVINPAGTVNDGSISGVAISAFDQSIQASLAKFGAILSNGIISLKQIVADSLTVKTARISQIEMVATNGDVYCTWIDDNGDWQKVKGDCATVGPNVQNITITAPTISTPITAPVTTPETTTPSTSTTQTANITSLASIPDINVDYGTVLSSANLPTTVMATMSDSTTQTISVIWDNGAPTYDPNTAGTYVFSGALTLSANTTNTSNLTAMVSVVVAPQSTQASPASAAGDLIQSSASGLLNGVWEFIRWLFNSGAKATLSVPVVQKTGASLMQAGAALQSSISSLEIKSLAEGLLGPVKKLFGQ